MTRQGAIYRDQWPKTARLYAGYSGLLPCVGEQVQVLNFLLDEERVGTVTKTFPSVKEYEVRFQVAPVQPQLF